MAESAEAIAQSAGYCDINIATNKRARAIERGANFVRHLQTGDILPATVIPQMVEGAVLPSDTSRWSIPKMTRFLEIRLFLMLESFDVRCSRSRFEESL